MCSAATYEPLKVNGALLRYLSECVLLFSWFWVSITRESNPIEARMTAIYIYIYANMPFFSRNDGVFEVIVIEDNQLKAAKDRKKAEAALAEER